MSEWHNTIVAIEKIEKHPHADSLSIAYVNGDYPVIIRTDDYNVGDLATYICVDTVLPDIQEYHHLSPKSFEQYEELNDNGQMVVKNRVNGYKYPVGSVPEYRRTIFAKKIRNIFSMGLLLPPVPGLNIGDDVSEILNLKKMEEVEEDNIPGNKLRGGNAAKPPSHFSIPYYDIESVRTYFDLFIQGEEVVVSEKAHGSNFVSCHDGEKLWVRSRNYYAREDDDLNSWREAANRLLLTDKLIKYPGLAFFGELIGLIPGFKYDTEIVNGRLETKIKFFDIYNTKTQRYLDHDEFITICNDLQLDIAPILYQGQCLSREEMYKFSEGQSALNSKTLKEGFVIKPVKERYEPKCGKYGGRLQLKCIGEAYLLQKNKR